MWFNYISKRQSDFVILRGFYLHKNKPSLKIPNLQYYIRVSKWTLGSRSGAGTVVILLLSHDWFWASTLTCISLDPWISWQLPVLRSSDNISLLSIVSCRLFRFDLATSCTSFTVLVCLLVLWVRQFTSWWFSRSLLVCSTNQ